MLKLTGTFEGKTASDVELALEETLRLVREGFLSGASSNDSGRLSFAIEGETESEPETDEAAPGLSCAECGQAMSIDALGIATHLNDAGGIDYDADADHVAFLSW